MRSVTFLIVHYTVHSFNSDFNFGNNVLLNLITGCLYWLTTCFGQLHDHHQVYKS